MAEIGLCIPKLGTILLYYIFEIKFVAISYHYQSAYFIPNNDIFLRINRLQM